MPSFCCVPGCSSDGTFQKGLAFHEFPTEKSLRKSWIHAIHRDVGPHFQIVRGSTKVLMSNNNYIQGWLPGSLCEDSDSASSFSYSLVLLISNSPKTRQAWQKTTLTWALARSTSPLLFGEVQRTNAFYSARVKVQRYKTRQSRR